MYGWRFLSYALLIGISAPLAVADANNNADPIRIDAMLCLTGACAEWGTDSLKGVQLAIETVNEQGGVLGRSFSLEAEDTAEDVPVNAVNAFHRLRTQEDIKFIVGPTWTPAALSLAPLIKDDKRVIVISPTVGVREFNESASNIFNTWPHDDVATRKIARYAIQAGFRRAGVFSSEQPWEKLQGDTFSEEFVRNGGVITAKVEPPAMTPTLKFEAVRIRDSQPDVVFFANLTQMHLAAKELKRLHYPGAKLAVLLSETQIALAEGALDGAVFPAYPSEQNGFDERFRRRFGTTPGASSATAYDAVMLYARAVQTAGTLQPQTVARSLAQTRGFRGVSGEINFDDHGGITRQPTLQRLWDNARTVIHQDVEIAVK